MQQSSEHITYSDTVTRLTSLSGAYFFLGGLFLTLGGIGEWIMGNTFPAIVFTSFGKQTSDLT